MASVTSGAASYAGKAVSSPNEATYGTVIFLNFSVYVVLTSNTSL